MLGSPFAAMGMNSLAQFGLPGLGLPGLGYPYPGAQALAHAGVRLAGMGGGGGGTGCVLIVSNLNETETEPDHLFILFGVYGDVQVNNLSQTG